MKFPETASELFSLLDLSNITKELQFIDFLLENKLVESNSQCKCSNPFNNKLLFWKQGKKSKKNLYYRCRSSKCRSRWSARNNIFVYNEASNLTIMKIVELIPYWSRQTKIKQVVKETKLEKSVVTAWFQKIREYIYSRRSLIRSHLDA